MHSDDYADFSAMLDGVASLLTRDAYKPNATNTALYFRALQHHDIATIRAAFDAHVRDTSRGRFVPTPADVLAQIETMSHDGRPGAEEAWAMVPSSEDETVVWTTEMAEAYGACSPLIDAGDRIGARMTFKEVYAKAMEQAKRAGQAVTWQASLGTDLEKRKRALIAAVKAGRMTEERAHEACPALPLPQSQRLLLPAPQLDRRETFREKIRCLVEAQQATPADPFGWARRLRDREKRGDDLSTAQKRAWRDALAAPTAGAHVGGFSPPPKDALPPAMRQEQHA